MYNRSKGWNKAEADEINKSLVVSSYLDNVFDALQHGGQVKTDVPDHSDGRNQSFGNETGALFSLVESGALFDASAGALSQEGMAAAMNDVWAPKEGLPYANKVASSNSATAEKRLNNVPSISRTMYIACQRYPALIEILGSDDGDKVAQIILSRVNELMVDKIGANTQEIDIHKTAKLCKADKQNIKQYFVGENDEWICTITASGPFRGNEAFYYDAEKDDARILRKNNGDYKDVTQQFNMIHEVLMGE